MINPTTSFADTLERMHEAFRAFLAIADSVPETHITWALHSVNESPDLNRITLNELHQRERQRRVVALFDSTTRELRLLFPEGIEG